MSARAVDAATDFANLDDHALVAQVLAGHREAFRHIMQRNNQRLFRIARSVVGVDAEAEDVLQESYLRAYRKLDTFRGDAALLTWLTSIVLNEARGRLRKRHPTVDVDKIDAAMQDDRIVAFPAKSTDEDPLAAVARMQVGKLLEQAIDKLPPAFRTVYVMREIEEYSVEETATQLELNPETVKTRLFRARRQLRVALQDSLATTLDDTFPFMGERCARLSDAVMARLEDEQAPSSR
ncbi:MAG TPA: RNA polymerase sigma factor [Rhodanobacter sp.]|jgi:RNA polymerase sigma-70 factor (ECF subfamily)|nr:RNA polymerase sigma factor [Rhodanobacter sp.]